MNNEKNMASQDNSIAKSFSCKNMSFSTQDSLR